MFAGAVAELFTDPTIIPYKDIPNFPVSTVPGHEGRLFFGTIKGASVICMQGRFHYFEGYPLWKCAMPVRLMKLLGVTTLIVSNAAGGMNQSYSTGDIMLINDHINFLSLAGLNPLRGPNDERFGPRFVDVNECYSRQLLQDAKTVAKEIELKGLQEGVYVSVGGPCFETVAEIKMLRMMGADAVGMSTVHEVIAAKHCGINCFAFSLITDMCGIDFDPNETHDHEEILEVGKKREKDVKKFVEKFIEHIGIKV